MAGKCNLPHQVNRTSSVNSNIAIYMLYMLFEINIEYTIRMILLIVFLDIVYLVVSYANKQYIGKKS